MTREQVRHMAQNGKWIFAGHPHVRRQQKPKEEPLMLKEIALAIGLLVAVEVLHRLATFIEDVHYYVKHK